MDAELIKRFNDKCYPEPNTGCWIWGGTMNSNGYGVIHYNRKRYYAHRFSFKLHIGEFDEILDVCHRCDNTACVNPYHLFIGTHYDNMMDKINKGRMPMGQDSGQSKLLNSDVKEIVLLRNKGIAYKEIANKYNVSTHCIVSIMQGSNWSHLTGIKKKRIFRL